MADQNRTVSVSLQLVYDPRSARAFQQMAQEAAKASVAARKQAERTAGGFADRSNGISAAAGTAANLGAYGFAGRAARIGGFAEGLQGLGMGGAATGLQRLALPLALAGGSVNLAERAALTHYDRYSTRDQINRGLVRDLVPGGQRGQELFDAFSGRAAGMEQAGISSQIRGAEARARQDRAAFDLSFNPRQLGAEQLVRSFRGQSAVAPGIFDRTTAEGERQYREQQRILPLKQAEAKAERDSQVATDERLAAQKELNKITQRNNELTKERNKLEAQPGTSGVNEQNRLLRIADINRELEGGLGLQRQAGEQVMGARNREIGARGEFQKAQLRTQKIGQAETLEGRVDTANAAALRTGMMDPFERAFGRQATRLIQQRGSIEGLPSEYVQAAMQFAPELVQSIIKKSRGGSDEFKADFAEFGAADFGTADVAGDSRKAQQARADLAKGEFAIDASSAEQLAASGRDFGKFVGEVINRALEASKSEILNTVRMGRNTN